MVTFLASTLEGRALNLGRNIDYSDRIILFFFLNSSRQMPGKCVKLGHGHFFPRHFEFVFVIDGLRFETLILAQNKTETGAYI